jgi:hypothetical protein
MGRCRPGGERDSENHGTGGPADGEDGRAPAIQTLLGSVAASYTHVCSLFDSRVPLGIFRRRP